MSFLKLGKKLQPAKKAWKSFTRKIHVKLHKLNKSNAIIKKPKTSLKPSTKPPFKSCFTFKPRLLSNKRLIKTTRVLRCYRLQKRPDPVYIDELFIKPVVVARTNKYISWRESTRTGTSGVVKEDECLESRICGADDMWESLRMASPLMEGIDERAEEFINRVRSEMQFQENMVAQRL